jgi:metallo-beta-lactamase class B
MRRRTLLLTLFAIAAAAQSPNWSEPFPPHRVVGNVYYVGSSEMASYLLATPAGHILISNGLDDTVPVIQAACEKLGVKFSDIKILLTCQAHLDHVGGFARIRKLTGAKTMVMAEDEAVVRGGGQGDFAYEGRM